MAPLGSDLPGPGSTDRPVVGLTTYGERARWGPWDRAAAVLQQSYVDAVTGAGAVPVLLAPPGPAAGSGASPRGPGAHAPPAPSGAGPGAGPADPGAVELAGMARSAVARLDALIVSGGADVGPQLYGHDLHPQAWPPQPDRDAWELALIAAALDRSLPCLCICRGAQLLNVHRGGTLHQHLPELVGHTGHMVALGQFRATAVKVEPGSRLETVVGTGPAVQCCHHQAIDRVGDGLEVVARAPDGVVEAVEGEGAFLVGVQWHPEEDAHLDLFEALVDATRRYRATRATGSSPPGGPVPPEEPGGAP